MGTVDSVERGSPALLAFSLLKASSIASVVWEKSPVSCLEEFLHARGLHLSVHRPTLLRAHPLFTAQIPLILRSQEPTPCCLQ